MKKILLAILAVLILGTAALADTVISKDLVGVVGSVYDIVWDGWKGQLILKPVATAGNLLTGELVKDGQRFPLNGRMLANPQESVSGLLGPGYQIPSSLNHRVVFWVDFSRTPLNAKDDQRFDGYMMTITKNAMAGVTWWNRIPFGFYAIKLYDIQHIK